MIDIVERLRFDAARCEATFSKGVAENIEEAASEIERLRKDARAYANVMLSEENDALMCENARLRAALEGYACLGKAACSEKKLKDGSCIREGVGTCGNDAFEALRGNEQITGASDK